MNGSTSTIEASFENAPSEYTVRSHYDPAQYRVSKFVYPKDTCFPGTMQPGKCFVIEGKCGYRFEGFSTTLMAGQYADLPGGDYEFRTIGDVSAEIVLVWSLPK